MYGNYKSILYQLDLIGTTPHLFIFNNNRYKSLFSSVLSIIILVLSLAFGIYSFLIYVKFGNPTTTYSKDNDQTTERSILFKDLFLIFQLFESATINSINKSYISFDAEYHLSFYNGTFINTKIDLEKCELGKNINNKYNNITIDLKNINKS